MPGSGQWWSGPGFFWGGSRYPLRVLRFYLGPVPVAVHGTFLFMLYIAYTFTGDVGEAGLMGAGIFAGLLVHEGGHAFTARRFGGTDARITLFALGGVTTYTPVPTMTPGRRFLIAASGSAAGIVAGLPVFLVLRGGVGNEVVELIGQGFWIAGLFWGVLNWVPIRPLDGGQMLTSALQIVSPQRGPAIAKGISVVVAGAAAAWLLNRGQGLLAFYIGFIAFAGLRDDPIAVDGASSERPTPEASAPRMNDGDRDQGPFPPGTI